MGYTVYWREHFLIIYLVQFSPPLLRLRRLNSRHSHISGFIKIPTKRHSFLTMHLLFWGWWNLLRRCCVQYRWFLYNKVAHHQAADHVCESQRCCSIWKRGGGTSLALYKLCVEEDHGDKDSSYDYSTLSLVWQHTPVVLTCVRLRQEDLEFKVSWKYNRDIEFMISRKYILRDLEFKDIWKYI